MVRWGVRVFTRLRPSRQTKTRKPASVAAVAEDGTAKALEWLVPSTPSTATSSKDDLTGKRYYEAELDKVTFECARAFDDGATQDEVYDAVAADVVEGALEGYNGTIFAYGQTGSGKTYTITGGQKYADRGIIPRALSQVFDSFTRRAHSHEHSCYISYIEIYNENVYDLLDRSHAHKPVEEWPKIQLMDDNNGSLHLKNLRVYEARTEEEALNLLFLGNVNRVTSETPSNMASSRSHCIFTMTIESRNRETETLKTSKVHLVDLAGSERVGKAAVAAAAAAHAGAGGSAASQRHGHTVRREGRYINLSLHYLEQVILSLHAKARNSRGHTHIPYRNSMVTSVLRDSLGGNCRTTFIATLNTETYNVDESISTCRFAQRCGLLSQEVVANEERDLNSVVTRLLAEKEALVQELRRARSGIGVDPSRARRELTDAEVRDCEEQVVKFIKSKGDALALPDLDLMLECLATLKDAVRRAVHAAATARTLVDTRSTALREREEEVRDNERVIAAYSTRVAELAAKAEAIHARRAAARLTDTAGGSDAASGGGTSGGGSADSERHGGVPGNGGSRDGAKFERSNAGADGSLQPMFPWVTEVGATSSQGLNTLLRQLAHVKAAPAGAAALAAAVAAAGGGAGDSDGERGAAAAASAARVAGDIAGIPGIDGTGGATFPGARDGPVVVPRSLAPIVSPDKYKRLLCTGAVFLKHGRRGSPHARFVWVDSTLHEVLWRRVGDQSDKAAGGAIRVFDIVDVQAGQMTKTFRRRSGRPGREAASFSLCTRDRSLDVEVVVSGEVPDSGCTPAEIRARDNWVEAFRFLVARAREHVSKTSAAGAAARAATAAYSRRQSSMDTDARTTTIADSEAGMDDDAGSSARLSSYVAGSRNGRPGTGDSASAAGSHAVSASPPPPPALATPR